MDEKFIFGMLTNIKVFDKLIIPFWVCVTRHGQSIENKKFAYLKLIFWVQISMKISYKLILWFLMGMVQHPQIYQNFQFVVSLQYLIKEVRWSWFFACRETWKFPASWFQHFGHQSLLQNDTIIIDGHNQAFSKYSK